MPKPAGCGIDDPCGAVTSGLVEEDCLGQFGASSLSRADSVRRCEVADDVIDAFD